MNSITHKKLTQSEEMKKGLPLSFDEQGSKFITMR